MVLANMIGRGVLRVLHALWLDFVVLTSIIVMCLLEHKRAWALLRRCVSSTRIAACTIIALLLLGASMPHGLAVGLVVFGLTLAGIGRSIANTASLAGVAAAFGCWMLGVQVVE